MHKIYLNVTSFLGVAVFCASCGGHGAETGLSSSSLEDAAALSGLTLQTPVPTVQAAAGLTGFVYHLGQDTPADVRTLVGRIAQLPFASAFSYPQSGNTLSVVMGGGDATATNSFIGATATGTAASDTNALATTAIDLVGAVHFGQAGSYTFALASVDDGAAVYVGGNGVPGSGTQVAELTYPGATTHGQVTVAQSGWYPLEVFWYNLYDSNGSGKANLNFSVQGPAAVQCTGAMAPSAMPANLGPGLQTRVYHRGTDASVANPPTLAAIASELSYAAAVAPTYSFVSTAVANGTVLKLSGGDGTPTEAFFGANAAGAAATDTAPLQTTLLDFVGTMQVTQAGLYSVSLALADDAAAFFMGGDGHTPGSGALVVQRNYNNAIAAAPGGANPQNVYLVAGSYPVELFYYNQTLSNTDGGAGLIFSITGPAAVQFVTQVTPATPAKVQPQWFYAGACAGTVLRAEAIPGRAFYAADGTVLQDPFEAMQQAGLNAVRVESFITDCVGPSPAFDNSGDVESREMNSQLDGGCLDIQVQTAQIAKEHNMKVVLTLNMGFDIPVAWQGFNYAQMLGAIDGEVRRQLAPFLQANIVPDIILLENEGTDGILYNITLPTGESYARGTGNNPNVSATQLQREVCGQLPTGNMASYPQLAGYYKQEVTTARDAIRRAGFDDSTTRFGLHSHGQYVDWKQSVVYSTEPNLELVYSGDVTTCGFSGVIPQNILTQRAADMLDIMGFSSYAEPMTPANPTSTTSMQATFTRLRTTLGLMDAVAQRYGKYTSGPFTGQYKKQGLGVEYASAFTYPSQIAAQQQHTRMYFQTLKAYPWFLGSMWWEPTYRYNNWEGGNATLYHNWSTAGQTNEAPTATLKAWGSFASSPKTP